MTPLVSIITPTFRHQQFIEDCIRSVLAQRYHSWELVVIDDASPDATATIVEQLARQDSRIRLYRHASNYGTARLADTYNEALAYSRGELIAVLEGDDVWLPGKLAEQVPAFSDPRVVLTYADYDEVTSDGSLILRHDASAAPSPVRSGLRENLRFFSQLKSFGANTVMARRRDLLEIGGFVDAGLPFVDYPTWLELAFHGDFVRVPSVLGRWRRHQESVYWNIQHASLERLKQHFLEVLRREHASLLAAGLSDAELEDLADNPLSALLEKERSRLYFEGKYRLVMGQRLRAVGPLGRALLWPGTPLRHRLAAAAGLVAAATSPRLLLSLRRGKRNGRVAQE